MMYSPFISQIKLYIIKLIFLVARKKYKVISNLKFTHKEHCSIFYLLLLELIILF